MSVLRVDAQSDKACLQFTKSLKETGFAVIYNHPIDQDLIKETYQLWQEFFASEDKNNFLYKPETQAGFFPQSVSETAKGYDLKDIKEYFHYYSWGVCPENLKENTAKLYSQLNTFASQLLSWVESALPKELSNQLDMPLSQMIENTPNTLLRILHYPPLSGNEPTGAVRAAAHGDINLLTLLVGATDSGLQVLDSENEWQDVPTDSSSIAVNIGDMLERATKSFYRSTLHRVVNPQQQKKNNARLSMPLFLHAHPDVKITPELTAQAYLQERLKELGVV